jgi:ribonucleoside-diphosphate reductase alpha subunit
MLTTILVSDLNKAELIARYTHFTVDLYKLVNVEHVVSKTLSQLPQTVTTTELEDSLARSAADLVYIHPDYALLGGRILMQSWYDQLLLPQTTFAEIIGNLYHHEIRGQRWGRVATAVNDFVQANAGELQKILNFERDFKDYEYFSLVAYARRGLEKIDGVVCEVPATMFLKVAVALNIDRPRTQRDIDEFEKFAGFRPDFKRLKTMSLEQRLQNIKEYYELLSTRSISVPGPILLHAGAELCQMASCFLQHTTDSLTEDAYHETGKVGGIMRTMTQLAAQSKGGGGNAINVHEVRSEGSVIKTTNGKSNGLLPFMKMFDATIGAINQSGKRAGTCVLYLEPWHKDILDFLDAADHVTIEERRCKNLFYALWVSDNFFERMVTDQGEAKWTLFDPAVVAEKLGKPLSEFYGDQFKEKYEYLESLGVGTTISLMEIWSRVCHLWQIQGYPYILSKDAINRKTNQKNLGTIKSSNLCTEIALVSNEQETAVCVLTSLCITRFYDQTKTDNLDYEKLIQAARLVTRHLNSVIDIQYYPTPETRNSCLTRRAIGVGLQGLADLFALSKVEFDSPQARQMNKHIYEAIYFGCLWESMELAKAEGTYTGFEGSPLSQGELQFDMWGIENQSLFLTSTSFESVKHVFGDNPWNALKEHIKIHGVRNSEVTALAPTASSSIRMQNNEMHEAFTRLVFVRQYIGGSVPVIVRPLVDDLVEADLWDIDMYNDILQNEGSIQQVQRIPAEIKARYRNVYELPWQAFIEMMADRSPFVSQTASLNHYVSYEDSGPTAFTQRILYGWKLGLKTLSYYIHTEAASTGKKEMSGVNTTKAQPVKEIISDQFCDMSDPDCEFCSA